MSKKSTTSLKAPVQKEKSKEEKVNTIHGYRHNTLHIYFGGTPITDKCQHPKDILHYQKGTQIPSDKALKSLYATKDLVEWTPPDDLLAVAKV